MHPTRRHIAYYTLAALVVAVVVWYFLNHEKTLEGIGSANPDPVIIDDSEWLNLDKKGLKEVSRQYFDLHYPRGFTVTNKDKGHVITLTKSGWKHSVTNTHVSYIDVVAFKKLDELIENAIYIGFGSPKLTDSKTTIGYFNYHADAIVNGQSWRYKISVRIDKNGTFYYDHYKKYRAEGPRSNAVSRLVPGQHVFHLLPHTQIYAQARQKFKPKPPLHHVKIQCYVDVRHRTNNPRAGKRATGGILENDRGPEPRGANLYSRFYGGKPAGGAADQRLDYQPARYVEAGT